MISNDGALMLTRKVHASSQRMRILHGTALRLSNVSLRQGRLVC